MPPPLPTNRRRHAAAAYKAVKESRSFRIEKLSLSPRQQTEKAFRYQGLTLDDVFNMLTRLGAWGYAPIGGLPLFKACVWLRITL